MYLSPQCSLLAGLLFAVHPVHVEAVSDINNSMNKSASKWPLSNTDFLYNHIQVGIKINVKIDEKAIGEVISEFNIVLSK